MRLHIREAREQAGLSQRELAAKIGVAPNTFHGYESGKHDPKSDHLKRIAAACGVSVDFLLGVPPVADTKSAPSISDEAMKIARDYDEMDELGQRQVRLATSQALMENTARQLAIESNNNPDLQNMWLGAIMTCNHIIGIMESFTKLNPVGQQEAAERVRKLTQISKYQKHHYTKPDEKQ